MPEAVIALKATDDDDDTIHRNLLRPRSIRFGQTLRVNPVPSERTENKKPTNWRDQETRCATKSRQTFINDDLASNLLADLSTPCGLDLFLRTFVQYSFTFSSPPEVDSHFIFVRRGYRGGRSAGLVIRIIFGDSRSNRVHEQHCHCC